MIKKIFADIWENCIKVELRKLKRLVRVCMINKYNRRLPNLLNKIHNKEKVKVVFFTINVGMWKNDGLFKLLQKSERFDPMIISYLFPIDTDDYRRYVQDSMRNYFTFKGYHYIDSYNFQTGKWIDMGNIKPDIIFYSQPYDAGFSSYRIKKLWKDCIFIYTPYCFIMEDIPGYNDLFLNNIAWKMFYSTPFHKSMGCKYAYNKGGNIVVTGNPMADSLITETRTEWNGWKQKEKNIKRVIWAPHHSILDSSTLHCSNFLDLAESMLALTAEYIGKIQFAFKPHPRLISQLHKHPNWGIEKTKKYYQKWNEMPNTTFIEGEYIDLFKSSDALVHDCSTFMGEYLYTKNPLMFIAKDNVTDIMNDFGKACFEQHYKGKNIDDIRNFLDNVVLRGNDPMRTTREIFFNKYLLPPNGKTASENMYQEMLEL